jgi:hypothetical protein
MSSIILNKILLLLIVFAPGFHEAKANTNILQDTTKLLAENGEGPSSIKRTVMFSNVDYPSILNNHREETLDYVKKFGETRRESILKIYEKGKKFFPSIEAVFEKFNIPAELKVLIALESGFNANAISPAGAVGYWQMMAAAAKHYGLSTSYSAKYKRYDDRKNLARSTVGAAKYLRNSHLIYNDILLTVGSYNCGVGGINNAIRKSGKKNATFWDIKNYLPSETRKYVMNFIAMNVILQNFDKFKNNELIFTPVAQEIQMGNVPLYNTLKAINNTNVE